jgi:spermidine/putrescine transport system ATP-binding protein
MGKAEDALLPGTLSNVVYVGTDTHYHIDLDSGGQFIVRQQNQPDQRHERQVGERVGVNFGAGIGQILKD